MAGRQPSGIPKALGDVIELQLRELVDNLRGRLSAGQVRQNERHWNSDATSAGLAAANAWVRGDASQRSVDRPASYPFRRFAQDTSRSTRVCPAVGQLVWICR